ncbi:MAG: LysM peptidoglycan-binding domain-containing protein [Cyclobacteriaceae bacterium]|nr:LysM peptidoglycan-binding domain-containing protein [Cyclobacteriaceae bacterium]
MKQSTFTSIIFLISVISLETAHAGRLPADSLGVRTLGGKSYIIHQVEKGETLYRLSRRYAVDVSQIVDVNPNADKGIQVGQELRIPYLSAGPATPAKGKIEHVVKAGETLFGIAGKYKVSVNDIKKWNSLRSNNLSVGNRLGIYLNEDVAAEINEFKNIRENNGKKIHIVNRGETIYHIASRYGISSADIIEWNRLENNAIYVGQELVIGFTDNSNEKVLVTNELKVETPLKEDVEVMKKETEGTRMIKAENTGEYKKVSEKGIARVIEGSEETKKYLALHRSAPIGAIMQVKNEMNDLSVFVRVIGKLPETGENTNILLKISKTAYDRLGAYDSQFPVEIIYHP